MESDPLPDARGSRSVSKPARQDRSIGEVARTWSRVVETPSERIADRSKDDLVQLKIASQFSFTLHQ